MIQVLKNSAPPRLTGDTEKDIVRMWDYLYKLAEELGVKTETGINLDDVAGAGYLIGEKGILPVSKGGTGANTRETASGSLLNVDVNTSKLLAGTSVEIGACRMAYAMYNDSIANGTTKPTTWGILLSLGVSSADWHQLWCEQANGGLYHRGGNHSSTPSGVAWTRILDQNHMKRADVVFGSDGIGSMACSGVTTTSAIIALRNSSHASGASDIYPVAEAWCETAGTVKIMLSKPMAGTIPVTVLWSK